MSTVGSGSHLDLGKMDGDGIVCFQAGKTELLWSAFFSQIRTRLGSAADVVACPHDLLLLWTDICRGKPLSIIYLVFEFFC